MKRYSSLASREALQDSDMIRACLSLGKVWLFAGAIAFACLFVRSLAAQTCGGGGGGGGGGGSDPTCWVEYQTAWYLGGKCGTAEFVQTAPPRVRMYNQSAMDYAERQYIFDTGTNGYTDDCTFAGDGFYYQTNALETVLGWNYKCPKLDMDSDTNWFRYGWYVDLAQAQDSRHTTWTCDYIHTYYYQQSGSSDYLVVTNYSPYQWGWTYTDTSMEGVTCTSMDQNGGPTGCTTNAASVVISGPGGNAWNSLPDKAWTTNSISSIDISLEHIPAPPVPPDVTYSCTEHISLTDEYTDQDMYDTILINMKKMGYDYNGAWWTPGPPDYSIGIAYSWMYDGTYTMGELQKMLYRFAVPSSVAGTTYAITWTMIKWDLTSGWWEATTYQTQVPGTGDPNNPAYSQAFEAPAPFWHEDTWGGIVLTWISSVDISAQRCYGPPGTGPILSASGCCGTALGTQLGLAGNGAAQASFSLGQGTNGSCSGSLTLAAATPSLTLASPLTLTCRSSGPDVQVISTNSLLRQVRAAQTLVDIVPVDPFSYEIRFYLPSDFQNYTNANGIYDPIGSPTPFVTWNVQNPDRSTNYNRLQLTETRGGQANVYMYTYNATSPTWTVDYPSTLRQDLSASSCSTNGTTYTRQVVSTVSVPGGAMQSKVSHTYQRFTGTNWTFQTNSGPHTFRPGSEALVQEILSPDSNPKTNSYAYDPSITSTNINFIPLKLAVKGNGAWEYYDYLSDGSGRIARVCSGFGDQAPPVGGPPDTNQCRYIVYDYTPLDPLQDDGTLYPNSARTTTSYTKGQIVAKTYRLVLSGQVQEFACQTATAAWTDPANLLTITKYCADGRVQSVLRPDGTMTIYSYALASDGSQTNTISSGQPNGGGTAIIDGNMDITILGPVGQMLSHKVSDILSGIVLSQDLYTNYDTLNRPQQIIHLDGTTEFTHYACCGIDYTVDRDSVTNFYGYDAMKRPITTTRLGITTSTILDAAGRTVQTIRTGSDNSQINQSLAQYDLASRLISQTNALGGITSYAEANDPTTGGLIRTTTNPDGGTRIESYFCDGSLKSVTGTAVHPVQYIYGVDSDGPYTAEIKVTSGGSTNEWVKTSTDLLGRTWKTLYPDGASSTISYNSLGQLAEEADPDGVRTLYGYNAKGELLYRASDTNRNDSIDFGGNDRISAVISDVTNDNGANVRRIRTWVWGTLTSNTSNLVSVAESSADGLRTWQTNYADINIPLVSATRTVYSTGGNRYITNTAPDGSFSITRYQNGLLVSLTRKDSSGNQLGATTYGYDAHGRQSSTTDARNGATTYGYNAADLVTSVTSPNPGTLGGTAQTTVTYYNKTLQATNVLNADGTQTSTEYYQTGEVKRNYGARTYPVGYGYDYAGRLKTMTNWSSFVAGTGARVTTWNYDQYRGWLVGKLYADNTGPTYSYTPGGRMKVRTWARGVTTTYVYDALGQLSSVAYSDSTPGVTYVYDRLGRQANIVQSGTTTTFGRNLAGQVLSESYSGGTLGGISITNGFDQFMRRTNLTALNSGSPFLQHAFLYDNGSRLQTVTDNSSATAYSATYTYVANSPLVSQITFRQNATVRMSTTKQWDFLNRLSSIVNSPSADFPISFTYAFNNASQRARVTFADASFWRYTYDSLGQVASGHKFFADQTPVAGQFFDYAFDDIGNRTQTMAGGDQNGANQRIANYYANGLNEYTNRDVPGYADIMGLAYATNVVTVNSQAAYRHAEYFRQQLPVGNSSAAQWTNITVSAPGQTTVTGYQFVAKAPETFTYDTDGNVTSDGRWNYCWDAENRLASLAAKTSVGPQQSLKFEYDSSNRRVRKQVWGNTTWSGGPTNDLKFAYDGWHLIAEANSLNSPLCAYVWGVDVSGSEQGGGGVGGLLESVYSGAATTNAFAAFDGGGNPVGLIDAAQGTILARFEYGAFGEMLRETGPLSRSNRLLFSTKYQDDETALLYYGYRYYCPSTGRWLSRDPAGENGGINLSSFGPNDSVNFTDPLGLIIICHCIDSYLQENGIRPETYTSVGDSYSAVIPFPEAGPNSGVGQILYKMLQSSRTFTIANLDVNELKRHVQARQNVVAATSKVQWRFGHDSDHIFNHSVWSTMMVRLGTVTSSAAVNDPFLHPQQYQTGCRIASMLIMLKGILDTLGASTFNFALGSDSLLVSAAAQQAGLLRVKQVQAGGEKPTLAEWIPGDRGYIQGAGSDPETAGEWIIYKGGPDNHFWGFDDPPHDVTLAAMMEIVRGWSNSGFAYENGTRWYPGVGLATSQDNHESR